MAAEAELGPCRFDRRAPRERVGIGCFVVFCGVCAQCRKGREQHCVNGPVISIQQVIEAYRFVIDMESLKSA